MTGGPAAAAGPTEHHGGKWSPYELNGGTSLGIAGADFAVIAADTRLSEGYSIMTRTLSRSKVLTPRCVIATGGCHTDVHTLHKTLGARIDTYRHDHDADMSCTALAQVRRGSCRVVLTGCCVARWREQLHVCRLSGSCLLSQPLPSGAHSVGVADL